ncbi:MAG TPA: RICIN domain-containing protein [Polyangia bacterium]|nr:RICIN domain-containing protein [Polyangia bacterium]
MARTSRSVLWYIAAVALSAGGCVGGSVGGEGSGDPNAVTSGGAIVRNVSAKCLDAAAAGTANGTKIQQYTCNGTGAQAFLLEAVAGGVKIVNTNSNRCIDVSGASTANDATIQLYDCNGTVAQVWVAEDQGNGYSQLRNPNSNKCIDVASASNSDGAAVQLYTCNGTSAQQWKISAAANGTAGGGGSGGGGGAAGGGGSAGGGGTGTSATRAATIKTLVAHTYVGATNGGGSTTYADRYAPQGWETFTLVDHNGGALTDGDSVSFQASGGQYLSASAGTTNAAATTAGATETFKIGLVAKADGTTAKTIVDGDSFSLQDSTGTYVSATNGGGSTLVSSATKVSSDETFQIGPATGLATTESLAGWTLSWSDEFNGAAGAIDGSKWTAEVDGSPANNELEYYTSRSTNVSVDGNGALELVARAESYGGRSYTSGRINTASHFTQAYGRFEARVWMPTGQGIWPAFWVLGDNIGDANIGWPKCGELDIMETIGTDMDHNHGSMHGPGYSGGQDITGEWQYPGTTLADGYHNYALEWQPNQVKFYVDGNLYETRTPADLPSGTTWVYDHPFFIILNVAVGGDWPGSPDATTVFPQTMKVDYVRVYTKS